MFCQTIMLNRLKQSFLNSRNIERDSYIWNTFQSILFATQSAFLLMVISRATGLDDAGVFSIAYAIASLIYYVGEFGVRKYQVTDVNEKVSFRDYHTHRVLTCILAVICSIVYAMKGFITGQYSTYKFLVIIIICVIKSLEAYCDVFFARYQQKKRLDVAAKASAYRIIVPMVTCMISLLVTKNMLASLVVWLVVTVFAIATSFLLVAPEFGKVEFRIDKQQLVLITRECLPLFAGSFLLLYVGNAPKYAIDAWLDDKTQACFNFIFMPVFAIGMLANFIFNPIIVELAEDWTTRNRKAFRHIVVRQMCIIAGITLLAVAVALTIGCPVLGALFGADLKGNEMSLTILMIGGGMLALANFFIVVVTVVRGQKYLMIGYAVAAGSAMLFSGYFVRTYGLIGAAVLYTTLMTITSIIFAVILLMCIRKERKGA